MIVVFAPDLMDRSKIQAAGGDRVRFVGTVTVLAAALADDETAACLVDLSRPGVVDAVAGAGVPVTGFVSHVDEERAAAARAVGVDTLARSVFFRRLAELVAEPT